MASGVEAVDRTRSGGQFERDMVEDEEEDEATKEEELQL